MTIRQRLLVSHLMMFFAPILMLLITVATVLAGVMVYIQSGNHVYIESSDQFNRAADILYNTVFHNTRTPADVDDTGDYAPLIQVLDPEQNYVLLRKGDRELYRYGNEALTALFPDIPPAEDLHELNHPEKGAYELIKNNEYLMIRKRTVDGVPYYLYYISHQAPHGTDDRLEHVSRGVLIFLAMALLAFIGLASWLLSRFILRRIVPPLKELRGGAEKIREGDLNFILPYDRQDEFTSVFTAFNTMTRALSDSLRRRAEEEESRKELIASMAHDIRTPLTSIKAYVEGLIDGVADTEEKKRRYLDVIRRKADEMHSMTEQLFLLSKMNVGDKAVPLELLDLGRLVRDICGEHETVLRQKGMDISFRGEPGCLIMGNPLLIERILLNLWSNSAKYKEEAGGHIWMTLKKADGKILLAAEDDGPGVPEEALPHLFEAFYRTDQARSHTAQGSGLGLAIAARAMEVMCGTIRASDRAPRGLRIVMAWPEAAEDQEKEEDHETNIDH